MNQAEFVKHNRAKLKLGKRDESAKMLLDFFSQLQGKVKGLAGYIIMDNIHNEQEMIVLTFWNTREDMDAFYRPENKTLSDFVEKSKPYFDQMPERSDHKIRQMQIA
jgi:heme-degrading monooxygenase HmoA